MIPTRSSGQGIGASASCASRQKRGAVRQGSRHWKVARGKLLRSNLPQGGRFGGADGLGARAAGAKPASARGRHRGGWLSQGEGRGDRSVGIGVGNSLQE